MQRKREKLLVFNIVIGEIFLLISMSFAIAFLISQTNIVSSDENFIKVGPPITINPANPSGLKGAELVKAYNNAPPGVVKEILYNDQTYNLEVRSVNQADTAILPNNGAAIQYSKNSWQVAPGHVAPKKFGLFGNTLASGGVAHLLEGFLWAGLAVGVITLIGGLFGASEELTKALNIGAFGGIMTWRGLSSLGPSGFNKLSTSNFFVSNAPLLGLGVGIAIFVLTYKKEKKKLVTFQCLPFEPTIGGVKCEECNNDPFRPCSEYKCRSLGQACQIVNKGTEEERCVWVNKNDVSSSTITPWTDALKPRGLRYVKDTSIRPPALGVKIVSEKANGCIAPFTPLEFGVTLNKPAQCKIDYNHTTSFDEMQYYFGGSNYLRYNHTQLMRLPGPENGSFGALSPLIKNDGTFSLYARCRDANGNYNVDEYAISFCVDPSPDTTPPIVEGTSIISGSPVQYNVDSVPIDVYTNEPSECKWSSEDKSFEQMENSMKCATSTDQVNQFLTYTCSANLTGIKNKEENKFFFSCKDQPLKEENERNTMTDSYSLTLRGSQPLNILSVAPNKTVSGSTTTVEVSLEATTDDGSDEGKAVCYFSNTNEIDSFVAMFETNNFKHKQTLSLPSGTYTYYFRCIDAGGNAAESITSFTVNVDKQVPEITRVYKELDAIKFITNEDAECTYSLQSCNFNIEEGLNAVSSTSPQNSHYVKWDPKLTYYVKCTDLYGNEPGPNECSLIANGVQLTTPKKA